MWDRKQTETGALLGATEASTVEHNSIFFGVCSKVSEMPCGGICMAYMEVAP